MSGMEFFPKRRLRGDRFVWDPKFSARNPRLHLSVDYGFEQKSLNGIIPSSRAFLNQQRSSLDPPQYNCTALKKFWENAKVRDIDLRQRPASGADLPNIALVDDRRDSEGRNDILSGHRRRDWNGYAAYPPEGTDIQSHILSATELYLKLLTSRCKTGAERRVIYIANMTPLCALAIASTSPTLQVPVLREFLQQYVSYRVSFTISLPFYGFALEFHLPYFALRHSINPQEDPRKLRRWGRLPDSLSDPLRPEYLYEAQISVLVTGFDEWFWTAYCCIDTFFGNEGEESLEYYHEAGLDAPTGGERLRQFPVWNPREYFLFILCRRLRQATKEWVVVVETLETRLQTYESSIFRINWQESLTDDPKFTRTRTYTSTVELLRLLYNAITRVIESWERFEAGEIEYFHVDQELLRATWDRYLADIEKDSNRLRSLRTVLRQKIETLDNMRNGLVNASAMVESRVATDQGKNIGRLTKVTVLYLPLSLATAAFSMTLVPQNTSWVFYIILVVLLVTLTLSVTVPVEMNKLASRLWRYIEE